MYDLRDLCFHVLEREMEPPELSRAIRQFYDLLAKKIPDWKELDELNIAWNACNTEYIYQGFDLGFHTAIRLIFEKPVVS